MDPRDPRPPNPSPPPSQPPPPSNPGPRSTPHYSLYQSPYPSQHPPNTLQNLHSSQTSTPPHTTFIPEFRPHYPSLPSQPLSHHIPPISIPPPRTKKLPSPKIRPHPDPIQPRQPHPDPIQSRQHPGSLQPRQPLPARPTMLAPPRRSPQAMTSLPGFQRGPYSTGPPLAEIAQQNPYPQFSPPSSQQQQQHQVKQDDSTQGYPDMRDIRTATSGGGSRYQDSILPGVAVVGGALDRPTQGVDMPPINGRGTMPGKLQTIQSATGMVVGGGLQQSGGGDRRMSAGGAMRPKHEVSSYTSASAMPQQTQQQQTQGVQVQPQQSQSHHSQQQQHVQQHQHHQRHQQQQKMQWEQTMTATQTLPPVTQSLQLADQQQQQSGSSSFGSWKPPGDNVKPLAISKALPTGKMIPATANWRKDSYPTGPQGPGLHPHQQQAPQPPPLPPPTSLQQQSMPQAATMLHSMPQPQQQPVRCQISPQAQHVQIQVPSQQQQQQQQQPGSMSQVHVQVQQVSQQVSQQAQQMLPPQPLPQRTQQQLPQPPPLSQTQTQTQSQGQQGVNVNANAPSRLPPIVGSGMSQHQGRLEDVHVMQGPPLPPVPVLQQQQIGNMEEVRVAGNGDGNLPMGVVEVDMEGRGNNGELGVGIAGVGRVVDNENNGRQEDSVQDAGAGSTLPQEVGGLGPPEGLEPIPQNEQNANQDGGALLQPPPPPAPPSGDADPQSDGNTGNVERRQLKVEDALAYLEKVKIQFSGQLKVYNKFLDIMKEFKATSIDTTQVIRRVSNLFSGHKELILGFNTFLPPGYQIRVTENIETGNLDTGFMGPNGYNSLPSSRNAATIGKTGPSRSVGRKTSSASSPKRKDGKGKADSRPVQGQAAGVENSDEIERDGQGIQASTPKGGAAGKGGAGVRRVTSKPSEGSLLPSPDILPGHLKDGGSPQLQSSEKRYEFEKAIGFVNTIKERFADEPVTFESFLSTLSRFRDEQKGIREVFEAVAAIFGPHKDLLQQFKDFLPAIALGALNDTKVTSRLATIGNQRKPLSSKTFSQSTPTRKGPGSQFGKSRYRARDMQFFEDLKKTLGSAKHDIYLDFIKCLRLFTEKVVEREELESLVSGIFENFPEANTMFMQYLGSAFGSGDETMEEGNGTSSVSTDAANMPLDNARAARYLTKPVSEMGTEFAVTRDGSYRLLPKDFPSFLYSGRSILEKKTLNDQWVSGTSGSEDYSFRFMRKNGFEDNLFRCEDDRYELDMLIETNAATIQRLETIVGTISRLPPSEKARHALAPGALSAINFSTIQRIYGETHGPEVISQIKLNPAQTVPVVINRLRRKDTHWRQARLEMNRHWREVGEKNFHKSLDHRSIQFKAADKRELNNKVLITDIMEPEVSLAARDAETTKSRGFALPSGSGVTNDRSGAVRAIRRAAKNASSNSVKSLEFMFEELWIHPLVFDFVKRKILEETAASAEGERIVAEFKTLAERFFDIEFSGDEGCRRANRSCSSGAYSAVLYGDDGVYVMLRYYHLLFERIMFGLTLAREQVADRNRRNEMNREGEIFLKTEGLVLKLSTRPSELTKPFANVQDKDHEFSIGPQNESAEEIFEEFLEFSRNFTFEKLDANIFEEKCRWLLGAGSYCLFNLDKTVQKAAKAVISVFERVAKCGSYGTIERFHKSFEVLEESMRAGGSLTGDSLEKVYSADVVAHIFKARGPGANVMRFQCAYHPDVIGRNQFVVHVVGKTGEGENARAQGLEEEAVEKFVKKITSGREEYKVRKVAITREREASTRAGGRDEGRSKKRERSLDCDYVRFCGSQESVQKRERTMSILAYNGLEWRFDKRGKLRAVDETDDFLVNQARKRKLWSLNFNAQEENQKCSWAKIVRAMFKHPKMEGEDGNDAEENIEVEEKGDVFKEGGDVMASEKEARETETNAEQEREKKQDEKKNDAMTD